MKLLLMRNMCLHHSLLAVVIVADYYLLLHTGSGSGETGVVIYLVLVRRTQNNAACVRLFFVARTTHM